MGSFKKFNELVDANREVTDDELCEEFGITAAERQKRLEALKKKMDMVKFNRENSKPVKGVSVDKGKPAADQKKEVADFNATYGRSSKKPTKPTKPSSSKDMDDFNKQYSTDHKDVSFDDGKPSDEQKKKLADFNKTYGKR